MLIQALETPNPHSIKFVPPCSVRGELESLFFRKMDPVDHAPFVQQLFEVEGTTAVFLGSDFITVTKLPQAEWYSMKPAIMELINDYLTNKKSFVTDESVRPVVSTSHTHAPQHHHGSGGGCGSNIVEDLTNLQDVPPTNMNDPIVQEIVALINDRVRPAVAQDGGDIVFKAFHEGIVYLSLQGACSGCPSSRVTLKSGVENMLRYYVPEVLEVRSVEAA